MNNVASVLPVRKPFRPGQPDPQRAAVLRQLESTEQAILQAYARILSTVERELALLHDCKAMLMDHEVVDGFLPDAAAPAESAHQTLSDSPLPMNVLPVSREVFAKRERLPREAAIDPALERATVEELNAALAEAFRQVAGF